MIFPDSIHLAVSQMFAASFLKGLQNFFQRKILSRLQARRRSADSNVDLSDRSRLRQGQDPVFAAVESPMLVPLNKMAVSLLGMLAQQGRRQSPCPEFAASALYTALVPAIHHTAGLAEQSCRRPAMHFLIIKHSLTCLCAACLKSTGITCLVG